LFGFSFNPRTVTSAKEPVGEVGDVKEAPELKEAVGSGDKGGLGTSSVLLLLEPAEDPEVEGRVRCVWFEARCTLTGGGDGNGLDLSFDTKSAY
jgi:hypothetical protein